MLIVVILKKRKKEKEEKERKEKEEREKKYKDPLSTPKQGPPVVSYSYLQDPENQLTGHKRLDSESKMKDIAPTSPHGSPALEDQRKAQDLM